jgi:hypothetical protein
MEFSPKGFWKHPLFSGVTFSQLEQGLNQCSPHFHLDYELTLVDSGVMEYYIGGQKQYLMER